MVFSRIFCNFYQILSKTPIKYLGILMQIPGYFNQIPRYLPQKWRYLIANTQVFVIKFDQIPIKFSNTYRYLEGGLSPVA